MAKPQGTPGGPQPSTLRQHAEAIGEQAGLMQTLTLRYAVAPEVNRLMDRATLRASIQAVRARLSAIEYLLDEDMANGG